MREARLERKKKPSKAVIAGTVLLRVAGFPQTVLVRASGGKSIAQLGEGSSKRIKKRSERVWAEH